jgi:hypothetical protein
MHRKILKTHGADFFENWKPTPKYTADGSGNTKKEGEKADDGEEEEADN